MIWWIDQGQLAVVAGTALVDVGVVKRVALILFSDEIVVDPKVDFKKFVAFKAACPAVKPLTLKPTRGDTPIRLIALKQDGLLMDTLSLSDINLVSWSAKTSPMIFSCISEYHVLVNTTVKNVWILILLATSLYLQHNQPNKLVTRTPLSSGVHSSKSG
ncbi:unnamed protein product [Lactuca saligna]|uniref:Uncharacterized protein n=1 Tax=Lactuca saligna TaxID=75948 RepID=A0AA36EA65_LACSI|nr:unnamed protein product [Lactuca saligna]